MEGFESSTQQGDLRVCVTPSSTSHRWGQGRTFQSIPGVSSSLTGQQFLCTLQKS